MSDRMEPSALIRALLVAAVLMPASPQMCRAGANAAATATLSWENSATTTTAPVPAIGDTIRVFVHLSNVSEIAELRVRLDWASDSDTLQFRHVSSWPPTCATTISEQVFSADSTRFNWRIRPPEGGTLDCIVYSFVADGAVPVQVCLVEVAVTDLTGHVDQIGAPQTIRRGADFEVPCPPRIDGLSHAVPGGSVPDILTITGAGLSSISFGFVQDEDGVLVPAQVLPAVSDTAIQLTLDTHVTSVQTLIAYSTSGHRDTLDAPQLLTETSGPVVAPLFFLGPGWEMPNSAVDPWSPSGTKLAIHGPDGVYVLDFIDPTPSPKLVLSGVIDYFCWAPRGDWLLCRTQSPQEMALGAYSLVAAPTDSGQPYPVLQRSSPFPLLWTQDGMIRAWLDGTNYCHVMTPPAAWLDATANAPLLAARPIQAWVPATEEQPGHVVYSVLSQGSQSASVSVLSFQSPVSLVAPQASFPDAGLFLATLNDGTGPSRNVVMTPMGTVVRTIGPDGGPQLFHASTLTPDGRFTIGFRTIRADDPQPTTELVLASTVTEQFETLQTPLGGYWPRCSPTLPLLAFNDTRSGLLYVCAITLPE